VGVRASETARVMIQVKNLLNDQVQDVAGLPLPGISFFITFELTGKEPRT
jgi:hypothetical protein